MVSLMPIKTISAQNIKSGKALILDVRTDMECAEKRLCCEHEHVPLDKLNPKNFIAQHDLKKGDCLYILCRSGSRARQAAEKFTQEGMTNIHVVEGGIVACEASGENLQGHLIETGHASRKTPISLERQVRIAAGLLVFIGSLLGVYLNTAFMILPASVGAGLIFAGVTDRCGMALVLTRMPWNKT